jgi:hypothetical protein
MPAMRLQHHASSAMETPWIREFARGRHGESEIVLLQQASCSATIEHEGRNTGSNNNTRSLGTRQASPLQQRTTARDLLKALNRFLHTLLGVDFSMSQERRADAPGTGEFWRRLRYIKERNVGMYLYVLG